MTVPARTKAAKLLARFMTPEQRAEYEQTHRFSVIDSQRNRRYLIGDDLQVRVYALDSHKFAPPIETWCVYLPGTPEPDSVLAQLLMLRDDPRKLRKLACVTVRSNYARQREMIYQRLADMGYPIEELRLARRRQTP